MGPQSGWDVAPEAPNCPIIGVSSRARPPPWRHALAGAGGTPRDILWGAHLDVGVAMMGGPLWAGKVVGDEGSVQGVESGGWRGAAAG